MQTTPNTETACPYCGRHFPKPPRRKSKCKGCGQLVIVKAEPETWRQRLMTIDEANAAELRWERFEQRRELIGALEAIGIGREYVDAVERNMAAFSPQPVPIASLVGACFTPLQVERLNDSQFWLSWSTLNRILGLNPAREQREFFRCHIAELLSVPGVSGVMVEPTSVCQNSGCLQARRFVSAEAATSRPPLPCTMRHECFGYLTAVFADEMPSWSENQASQPSAHRQREAAKKTVTTSWWRKLFGG